KAVALRWEALRRTPNLSVLYATQASDLLRLNRYAEARELLQRALDQELDSTVVREQLYTLAFINGDTQAMQEHIAWANGKPDEHRALDWQVQTSAFAGEWRKSQDHLRRAVEIAAGAEEKENAADYSGFQAVRAAWLGQYTQAVALSE